MKKFYFALFLMASVTTQSFAQVYPGYRTENYTGVNGVFYNPASIADSRYKFDVNLFSINIFVGNNQASLSLKDVGKSFKGDSLKSILFGGNKANLSSLINTDIYGPSVMFNLNRRMAMAVTTRTRVFANARNIDGTLAQTFIDGGEKSPGVSYPSNFNADNTIINAAGWSELGLSFSSVLTKDKSIHFMKAGVSVKYLAGTANAYLNMKKVNGTIGYNNPVDGTYLAGTTGNIDINTTNADFSSYKIKNFFEFTGHGIGTDIGLEYEFRPLSMTKDNYKYKDDRFANKYKFKVGLSLLDVGNIKFNRDDASSGSYAVNIPKDEQFKVNQFKDQSLGSYTRILDTSSYFTEIPNTTSRYNVVLPTTLQFNVDYNINDKFFINAGGQFAFSEQKNLNLYSYNAFSITPRFETKMFAVAVPVNYNLLTKVNVGLSLRAGPFFVGSGSAFTALFGKSKQADIHTGLHIGIPYKKKKRPDTDKDGIFDDVDKCVAVAGLERYQGCPIPDTDGDGVNDEVDKCPSVTGVAKYEGCPIPDTDGDGVNDEMDKCPSVAGIAKYEGCPVPDSDKDGVNDELDKCPTVPGVAKYEGCPVPDTDKDGVNDDEDKCPNRPGPLSNQGCPVIAKEVIEKINFAAKNIFFATGSAKLLPKSFASLNQVAKLLAADESLMISISGHTDNTGKPDKNQTLSEARAASVKQYLVSKGVTDNRATTAGFGDTKPVADNKTAAGRGKNRRTEMTVKNF